MRIFTLSVALLALSINSYSQTQTTLAGLRSASSASITTPYFVTDQGREGIFYYDPKDVTSADNNGTIIVNGLKRYKRSFTGSLDVRWFGGAGDWNGTSGTDNTAAITAAINASSKGQTVMIPTGSWYIKSTIALPIVTVKKVPLQIFGNVFFAKGSGFVLEGNDQELRSYGIINGGNPDATTEAAYMAYTGVGVYLKNAVNSHVEVNEILNFKYGIQQSGDRASGVPVGSQYNTIYFNSIHNNYVQIKLSIIGNTSSAGNWCAESFWYGGQLGRGTPGVSYGAGGWYGMIAQFDPGSSASHLIDGHIFHNIGFEGLEKALVMKNCSNMSFLGGGIEPDGVHYGFDLDPTTCTGTRFVGYTYLYETNFVAGRIGANTTISATPFWVGPDAAHRNFAGNEASSTSASRWMITAPKYSNTNFTSYNTNDLNTISGVWPSLQSMTMRINGVTRTVGFKSTFLHVTSSTAGSPIMLPPNIGCVRVEATQAKVFKIDSGDLAQFGEGFIVEYLSPNFPISFIRSDNGTVLIASTSFPSAGTYRCTWAAGQYKIARIGEEFKSFTQLNSAYSIADGIQTVYVNYIYGASTTTLPSAAAYPGRTITIKNMQAGSNVTVNGIAASDESLMQGRGAMTVRSDGTTWNVISFYKKAITY
jgi:hypothetical protein